MNTKNFILLIFLIVYAYTTDCRIVQKKSQSSKSGFLDQFKKLLINSTSTSSSNSKILRNVQNSKPQPINLKRFANDVLQEHNKYRRMHGVPPLQLDDQISKTSQRWSQKMVKAGNMYHSPLDFRKNLGENLFYSNAGSTTGHEVVKLWYDEIKKYKFGRDPKPEEFMAVGHFSQCVWSTSKKLGVGIASGRSGTYVTCHYRPPGNYQGEHATHVFPPKKLKKTA